MSEDLKLDFDLKLPDDFQMDYPKIISKIRVDMLSGDPYHYLFTGKVGTGKTLTAKSIIQSYPKHYEYYPSNNPIARSGMIIVREFYREYLDFNKVHGLAGISDLRANEKLMNKRFLCIDDVGNEKPRTDAAHEYIGSMIEKRYEVIKNNWCHATIMTTNLDMSQLKATYGVRVIDRIYEVFQIMEFERREGKKSHRREKASEPIKG